MNVIHAEISSIDLEYDRYRIGPSLTDPVLEESLAKTGVLNPVKLIGKGDGYLLLSGWKRVESVLKTGETKIPAITYAQQKLDEETRFLLVYFENYQRINELDKAEIIYKLTHIAKLDPSLIVNDYMKILGISPSYRNYEKYMKLAGLEKEIRLAYYKDELTLDHLLLLSDICSPQLCKDIYNFVISDYKFNANESREVLRNITEISLRDGKTVNEIISEITAENGKLTKNEFRKLLKYLRYPVVSRTAESFRAKLNEVEMNPNLSINHHPYFESNDLEYRISFRNEKELKESIDNLMDHLENGTAADLLRFIRHGS